MITDDDSKQYTVLLIYIGGIHHASFQSTEMTCLLHNQNLMLQFAPFEGPLLESSGRYELTFLLKGEVSTPVSVDVLDGDSKSS